MQGTLIFSTGAGRNYYYGFDVVETINNKKKRILLDSLLLSDKKLGASLEQIIVLRNHRHQPRWIFQKWDANDMRFYHFTFGEKRSGFEEGIF